MFRWFPKGGCFEWKVFGWVIPIGFALVAGCATKPKIDWDARLGSYTYDQAVIELGPPDKEAELSDGGLVTEWITRQGYYVGYPSGGTYYGGYYPYLMDFGFSTGPTYFRKSPDSYLRLVFDPDRLLVGFSIFRK